MATAVTLVFSVRVFVHLKKKVTFKLWNDAVRSVKVLWVCFARTKSQSSSKGIEIIATWLWLPRWVRWVVADQTSNILRQFVHSLRQSWSSHFPTSTHFLCQQPYRLRAQTDRRCNHDREPCVCRCRYLEQSLCQAHCCDDMPICRCGESLQLCSVRSVPWVGRLWTFVSGISVPVARDLTAPTK